MSEATSRESWKQRVATTREARRGIRCRARTGPVAAALPAAAHGYPAELARRCGEHVRRNPNGAETIGRERGSVVTARAVAAPALART